MRPSIAHRWDEESEYFSGTKMAPQSSGASYLEKEIYSEYKGIKAAAKSAGQTMEEVSLTYLLRNLPDLVAFIRFHGETPAATDNATVVQAMLLRMQDINLVSSAGDLSEDQALEEILKAESEGFILDTGDKENILNPGIQAALNCLIVFMLNKMQAVAGQGSIAGALSLIKEIPVATPVNNAIGDNISAPGGMLPPLDLTLTGTAADTNGDSSSSFWDTLNQIAATASTVAGAVKQVGSAVSQTTLQVSNAVQTVGANTGASAISLYMQRNGITILIIAVIAIILLILLSRATASK